MVAALAARAVAAGATPVKGAISEESLEQAPTQSPPSTTSLSNHHQSRAQINQREQSPAPSTTSLSKRHQAKAIKNAHRHLHHDHLPLLRCACVRPFLQLPSAFLVWL